MSAREMSIVTYQGEHCVILKKLSDVCYLIEINKKQLEVHINDLKFLGLN